MKKGESEKKHVFLIGSLLDKAREREEMMSGIFSPQGGLSGGYVGWGVCGRGRRVDLRGEIWGGGELHNNFAKANHYPPFMDG